MLNSTNQEESASTQNNYESRSPEQKTAILLVDNEQELAELGQLILGHYGYRVRTCLNANEALQWLEESAFDLVITDVVMPGMSGYELSTETMNRYPETKIQLVSGYATDQQSCSHHQQLQRRLIRKPYKSNILLQRVEELLVSD